MKVVGYYWPESICQMQWSAIGIGNFKVFKRIIKNVEVNIAIFKDESPIWLSGPENAPANVTQGLFEVFDHHINLFGDFPYEKYLIIITPLTNDGKGVVTSSAQENSYATFYSSGGQGWSSNIHEMFHAWNPHSLNLNPPTEYGFHWFREGFTTYYGERTLVDLGWQEEDHFYNWLQRNYEYYIENILGTAYNVPLSESGDLMAEIGDEPYVFVTYHKGALLAFFLDHKICEVSEGRLCLDDFMRFIYVGQFEYVLEALNTLTQYDFTNFFNSYVDDTDKLPLEAYFLYYNGENNYMQGNYKDANTIFSKALELFFEESNQYMIDKCEVWIDKTEKVEKEVRVPSLTSESIGICLIGVASMIVIAVALFIIKRKF